MPFHERIGCIKEPFFKQSGSSIMAKPGIPVEKPQRREVPDIPDPMPQRLVPAPSEPVKTPRKPVTARQ